MNYKRMLAQSLLGQKIRREIHKRKANRTYEEAVEFLKKWGGGDEKISIYAKEMYTFCEKYNYTYQEYMFYHFHKKSLEERLSFISSEERIYCCEKLNKAKNWHIFENKANTYMKYKHFFRREVRILNPPYDTDTKEALKIFINKNPLFIAKTLNDAGGVGIQKYDLTGKESGEEWINSFLAQYPKGCLCEELIVQAEEFAKFHPESVNTLRITTVRFDDHVEIIHPAMRIGTGNSFVDNAGSNGILCAIDYPSGKIIATANERGEFFEYHPDTRIKLVGCQIPHFEEAIKFAKELAQVVPDNRYTGWDLAYTDNGWVLVEANSYGGFVIWQIPLQKGFREEWQNIIENI